MIGCTELPSDLISGKDAIEIANARLEDVPDSVDLEADRNLFAAGYLAAAGSIKAGLQRAAATAAPVEQSATETAKQIVGTIFDNTGASHETLKRTMIERITQYLEGAR